MADEDVKVCSGILLVRSKSGTSKIEKVLVESKHGKRKNQVKCRLQKFAKQKRGTSRIPVLVKVRRQSRSNRILRSLHSSLTKFLQTKTECTIDGRRHQSGDHSEKEMLELVGAVEKNRDSTIHLKEPEDDDFEDDDDDYVLQPPFEPNKKHLKTTIVMAQYASRSETQYEGEGDGDDDFSESANEEFDVEPLEGEEYDEKRYLDSGLRPLRSDESKLRLDPVRYRSKKTVTSTSDEEGIEPLLEEIPSDIFVGWAPLRKKKSSKAVLKKESSILSRGDFTSSEEILPEHEDIDTGPLKKLQEMEDVTFTIKADDFKVKQKDDFCVHTKDEPGHLTEFSSTTFDEVLEPKDKKKRSIFRFFKKDDFCVHTFEPPGTPIFSDDSSQQSLVGKKTVEPIEMKVTKDQKKKRDVGFILRPSNHPAASVSQAASDSSKQTSGSSSSKSGRSTRSLLYSSKERRLQEMIRRGVVNSSTTTPTSSLSMKERRLSNGLPSKSTSSRNKDR